MKSYFVLSAIALGASINPFKSFGVPNPDVPISICDKDDSIEAKCAMEEEPLAYQTSKAILRVTKSGSPHCTAWLVGDQGHIITNNHCASAATYAKSLKFEAMAEGATCATNCKRALACKGVYIHQVQLNFVATAGNTDQDWSLFQLPAEEAKTAVEAYGFLKIRVNGSYEGERIYVAGYPRGYGKRIAFMDGAVPGTILNRNFDTGCGTSELIYRVDTEGGNSGSPVISYNDHTVVGLHHCGGCSDYGNSVPYFNNRQLM